MRESFPAVRRASNWHSWMQTVRGALCRATPPFFSEMAWYHSVCCFCASTCRAERSITAGLLAANWKLRHVHVNNPEGNRLDVNGRPVAPESPEAHCHSANLDRRVPVHDWTFEGCELNWARGVVRLLLRDRSSQDSEIVASGLVGLKMRRDEPWGPSVSVLSCSNPTAGPDGISKLIVELQSGDAVEVEARQFDLPSHAEFA